MRNFLRVLAVSIFLSSFAFGEIDPGLLAGLKARSIGPASMSGRVAAVDAVHSNPDIVYVGAATGGVWKSENGGNTWAPIFDDQKVAAIGAVSIYQANPDIVWVGTGEGNVRNSASVGNGVYKTLDGGKTWKHLGLDGTERISRISLHPNDPNVAFVAAMGREWGENAERGVFKTVDGGKTWTKVLFVNEKTGCADLSMDPSNPNKLFAAMWEFRRWPWFFRSGGPGSGLHVTVDGGQSWSKLTEEDGLPKGLLGRIGVAFSRANSQIVYAIVEAQKSAVIRSEDGGRTWKAMNEETDVAGRPFYYADIRVDPVLTNRIYRLESLVRVSNDAGKSWEVLIPFRDVHPDYHALWINNNDPTHMIVGNDGGIAVTHDRGLTWRFAGNIPLAQFYHIRVDMDTPYNVYGGLQDNGSWRGPSEVWESGGIRNHHWVMVGFGDGFDTAPDPKDSSAGYSMSQEGYLMRYNVNTGERIDIRPPAPDGQKLRFNWNAGLAVDQEDGAVYYGSQYVHKSTDRGNSWTIISPDLTSNKPEWQKQDQSGGLTPDVTGAENFTTIIAITISPLDRNILWVGTDDGRLHVTRDGGKNWSSVEKNVKDVPANTWIPHIEPSKHEAGSAFVVFDDHRRSNWTPYVYETNDFGKTWKSLATKELWGYALAIAQDSVKKDLLFLGTEFGLYVSLNGGKNWMKWTHGFPTVSTMDLTIHPREQDLVIGTHGRALYIIDDITPLRTLNEEILKNPVHVFAAPDTHHYQTQPFGRPPFAGHSEFRGESEPYGAMLTYSLNVAGLPYPDPKKEKELKEQERQKKYSGKEAGELMMEKEDMPVMASRKEDDKGPQVDIEVADEQGNVIRRFKAPAKRGVNRASWDLRRDAFREPPRPAEQRFFEPSGPEVLPGTYTVTVKYKEHQASSKVRVTADPRDTISDADRKANFDALARLGKMQETATDAIEKIQGLKADIDVVMRKVDALDRLAALKDPAKSPYKNLRETGSKLKKQLEDLERKFWQPPKTKGIPPENDAMSKISYAQQAVDSAPGAPTPSHQIHVKVAEDILKKSQEEYTKVFEKEVPAFKQQVEAAKISLL